LLSDNYLLLPSTIFLDFPEESVINVVTKYFILGTRLTVQVRHTLSFEIYTFPCNFC
jgi:hypothetical protein